MSRTPIHFDMETSDPDDVMTLAILACHPRVELAGVSVTPGSPDQMGLVKHVLYHMLGVDPEKVGVGGDPKLDKKQAVSGFHTKWIGRFVAASIETAAEVIQTSAVRGAALLTGAPLKNLEPLLDLAICRWVAQGGFAGDSVVPPEHRLAKFAGRETCPTFNFGGAPRVAEAMLASPAIKEKILVGKNVCHGVAWDQAFHERVKALPKRTAGLDLVLRGMELYLEKHPEGKKLHDPLAMAVAIDPSVCEFRCVEMYRLKGEWGARLKPDGDVQIAVAVNRERFFEVLTEA